MVDRIPTMTINPLKQNIGRFLLLEISDCLNGCGQLVWELVPRSKISAFWEVGVLKHKDQLITEKFHQHPCTHCHVI